MWVGLGPAVPSPITKVRPQLAHRLLTPSAILTGTAGLVAVAALSVGAAEAGPVTGGWYANVAQSPPSQAPPIVTTPPAPAPDVPAGDFTVAASAGQPQRETYVHLNTVDASLAGSGATVTHFEFTLKEDPAAAVGNASAASAKVRVLPVKSFFQDGAAGAPSSTAPSPIADGPAGRATRAANGVWTFDVTAIVAAWLSGSVPDNGIALLPDTSGGPSTTFAVVWTPSGATTRGVITPTPTTTITAPTTSPSLPSTPSTPASPQPSFAPTGPAPLGAPALTSAPTTLAPVATSQNASGPSQNLKPARAKGHRSPPLTFAVAALGVLAVVGLGTVALGELGEPIPPRRGSVVSVLERRMSPSPSPEEHHEPV